MPEKQPQQKEADRVAIISAVKTYLGFFVLVVLVVESVLGALALKTQGPNQLVALFCMLFVIVTLIAVVSFFAYQKPDALLRTIGGRQEYDLQPLQAFGSSIAGHWWERIKPDGTSSISYVEIRPDPSTGAVKMKGSAYGKTGEPAAFWESVASCINPGERKIFYYWKGWHPLRPNEPYEGIGEVSFHESSKGIESGVGLFSDTNLTDVKSTTKKSIEFHRCEETEVTVMEDGNEKTISEMVRKKLG